MSDEGVSETWVEACRVTCAVVSGRFDPEGGEKLFRFFAPSRWTKSAEGMARLWAWAFEIAEGAVVPEDGRPDCYIVSIEHCQESKTDEMLIRVSVAELELVEPFA